MGDTGPFEFRPVTDSPLHIRPAAEADIPAITLLNLRAAPHVNIVNEAFFRQWIADAAYFRVAERNGALAGLLIAHTANADYDSLNFQWFRERYDAFVYVDRIVVAESARRAGIGTALYNDLADFARPHAPRITCEVNLRPPNETSVRFHERHNFREVGQQDTENGNKTVSLMERAL